MATMKAPTVKLESMEDILSFEMPNAKEKQIEIEISILKAYPKHKYKLYEGERLKDMVESIRENGVLMPVIVWKNENEHIILSGHNRANAAKLAGLDKIPCIIKEGLSESEAATIVHETNLLQRSFSDLSHSEKAYCLAQHYENVKSQGKRNDKINDIEKLVFSQQNTPNINEKVQMSQFETKLRSDEKVGNDYALSRATIARYIRLGENLTSSLFALLDKEQIAFNAAYLVSFLSQELQDVLADLLENEGYKLDIKKAEQLKASCEAGSLRDINIVQILTGDKKSSIKVVPFKVPAQLVYKYFEASASKKEIENTIEKALQMYFAEEYI